MFRLQCSWCKAGDLFQILVSISHEQFTPEGMSFGEWLELPTKKPTPTSAETSTLFCNISCEKRDELQNKNSINRFFLFIS